MQQLEGQQSGYVVGRSVFSGAVLGAPPEFQSGIDSSVLGFNNVKEQRLTESKGKNV